MPDFTTLFIEELSKKKKDLLRILSKDFLNIEESFKNYFKNHWHPLIENNFILPIFAIDASQRILSLAFGPYLILSQGLAIGDKNYEKVKVNIEAIPGYVSHNQLENISDLILQNIEMDLALQIIEDNEKDYAIFIDGSLSSRISHLIYLYSIDLGDFNFLREDVLRKTIKIVQLSKERDLLLVSISKISRDTFLSQILLESEGKVIESKIYPTDTELISYLIPHDTGFSTPLLLGGKRILGKKQWEIIENNPNISELLKDLDSFVNLYIRLLPQDQPLRIDFPAYIIKRNQAFLNTDYEFIRADEIEFLISLINNSCGGIKVYQTHLYLVDQLVRLRREPDLDRYMMILEKELGTPLPLDRSQRRFF